MVNLVQWRKKEKEKKKKKRTELMEQVVVVGAVAPRSLCDMTCLDSCLSVRSHEEDNNDANFILQDFNSTSASKECGQLITRDAFGILLQTNITQEKT